MEPRTSQLQQRNLRGSCCADDAGGRRRPFKEGRLGRSMRREGGREGEEKALCSGRDWGESYFLRSEVMGV